MAAACQGDATAQQAATDPLGPVRCYQTVTAVGLAEDSAVQLCGGAINAAPGQCYATSVARFTELSSQKIQQLCFGTTSMQPVACYANLSALGSLTEDQILSYCATECAAGPPPPQTASPACADVALNRANLSLQQTQALCAGSRSAGPALCYVAGDANLHMLASDKLISLCADVTHCQYPGSRSAAPRSTGY
jgi:hypothetical protein